MICQDRHEIYIIVAEYNWEYVEYIRGEDCWGAFIAHYAPIWTICSQQVGQYEETRSHTSGPQSTVAGTCDCRSAMPVVMAI